MKKYLLILTIVVFIILTFAGCKNSTEAETTTEKTTELTTVETTEEKTEKETEENTTKAPETTKPKPQPTQPKPTEPKPTEKPDVEFEDKPAGSGGLDMSGAGTGPNTNHVGGETPEENDQMVQDTIDKNGWDLDWELN